MRRSVLCMLVSTAVVSLTAPALGIIIPARQNREIRGNAYAELFGEQVFDADSETAADFGPFNTGASAQASVDGGLGSGGGTQNSVILQDAITASGSAFATGESWDFDSFADGSGESEFCLEFTVTTDSTYTLTGEISAFDNGISEFHLRDGNGIIDSDLASDNQIITLNYEGVLTAGTYWLLARSEGSAFGGSFLSEYASGDYMVQFDVTAIPCQTNCADIDGDGDTDLDDATALTAVLIGSPIDPGDVARSDLNNDGNPDGLDIQLFTAALVGP